MRGGAIATEAAATTDRETELARGEKAHQGAIFRPCVLLSSPVKNNGRILTRTSSRCEKLSRGLK